MQTLQRKATPEHYAIAETLSSIQDAHPDTFRAITQRAAAVYLELYHRTEPNGDNGDRVEGRAAAWPMYRERYTPAQKQCLRVVSLCALTDALLSESDILPDALPFVVLTRTLLFCGDGAGFTMPLLESGLDFLKDELESAGNWENPAYIPNSDVVRLSDKRLTLSRLSKILDSGNGGIRFERKGNRCKIHIDDAKWLIEKIKTEPDYFTEAAFNQYMNDAEETKKQIQKEKTRQR